MNFLNPEFAEKSFPLCSFLDENFYSVIPLTFYYVFQFPDFVIPEHILLKRYFLFNLDIFNTDNYSNLAEMKVNNLYEHIYYFVINCKDINEVCGYCDIKYRSEIINFVEFLSNNHRFSTTNINTIKNYKISYEALKEFNNVIAWYFRNIVSTN